MNYKVIINPEITNNSKDNDYNMKISKKISDKLTSNNISNLLIDNSLSYKDRLNLINNNSNSNTVIITNGLGSDKIEIIYSIKDSDNLASRLSNNLEDNGFVVSKYYQYRNSSNTNLDYYDIMNDVNRGESIIIDYGNLSTDNSYLNGRIEELTNIVVNTLKSYLGLANDTYIVKKGDNLYSIARKYNTTVDTIKKLNNLTNNNLSIGQKLVVKTIPSSSSNINTDKNTYIVKNGDTLYAIARKYNTTVDNIKKLNNLTNNNLNINQVLKIPSTNINEYKVVAGDTLYSIANKYNTTIKDIMNLNNLKTTNLSINQILKIPK